MKRSLIGLVLAGICSVGIAVLGSTGCSSSSSGGGGGGGGGISCESSDKSTCVTYPAGSVTTCPTGMSTSSCASTNQLGCCDSTVMGSNGQSYSFSTCYYCEGALAMAGSASTFSGSCMGSTNKWTAGDKTTCGGGSSSSSGSSSGGSGDASGD